MINTKNAFWCSYLKFTLFTFIMLLLIPAANAQNFFDRNTIEIQHTQTLIKGIVVDESLQPLKDIHIFRKQSPTIKTDANGCFSLSASRLDTLSIWHPGKISQEVPLQNYKGWLTIYLYQDIEAIKKAEEATTAREIKSKIKYRILKPDSLAISISREWDIDTMAVYPGGERALIEFLKQNTCYPEEAKKNKIEGRVICSFVVNTSGQVTNIEVVRGVCEELDEEALRVFCLMPDWTPGILKGKPVCLKYTFPVTFKLDETAGSTPGNISTTSETDCYP